MLKNSISVHSLNLYEIALIGLYLDDPFGDGFRLKNIREPNIAREAAIAEISGAPMLDGERLIRSEYEDRVRDPENWKKNGELVSHIKTNLSL